MSENHGEVLAGLTRDALAIYEEHMGKVRDEMRAMGRLGVEGKMLEEVQLTEANRKANVALVEGLIKLLPGEIRQHEAYRNALAVADPHEARQATAKVLWRQTPYTLGHEPQYVIGSRAGKRGRHETEELLLFSRRGGSTKPFSGISIFASHLGLARSATEAALAKGYTQEQLQTMLDKTTESLCVSAESPGSARYIDTIGELSLFYLATWGAAKKARRGDLSVGGLDDIQLTDDTMEKFGVLHHLNDLAITFGQVEGLDALLKAWGDQRDKASVDAAAPAIE